MVDLHDVGIVVIGRNEGERLVRCLDALSLMGERVIYVDSGSADGSVEKAQRMGAQVIVLDDSLPYTAARSRNAGFEYLSIRFPQLRFVQFLDGDCEIAPGWLETSVQTLRAQDDLVMVCGRLRERFPGRSIYNLLCDMEWNTNVGESRSCGGNCMVRMSAFSEVSGFNSSLIAGEEPELCWRLIRAGGKIWRLPDEMATHDAALHSFGQWWRRQVRAGHAAAENVDLHGREDRGHYVREVASVLVYGGMVPIVAGVIAYASVLSSCILLVVSYLQLFFRVRAFRKSSGDSSYLANIYAAFTVLVKFPQILGLIVYVWRRKVLRSRPRLIEYKNAGRLGASAHREQR